ncbi:hypothetical protein CSAL01_11811 [Colletotrichum salicis]|uniref:Uncharacterized protein n=1 Tax=Colletotrichum salicis TaxID=1209931 RepID=A0A135V0L2_9PEZI|nr:hypothetical protein CSAL01_11811 [Colletotrichum salicis]
MRHEVLARWDHIHIAGRHVALPASQQCKDVGSPTSRLAIVACAAILIPARPPPPARLAVANSARAHANQVGNLQDLRQRSLAQHHQQLEAAMLSGKMAKKSPIVDGRVSGWAFARLRDRMRGRERPGGASRPRAGPGAQAASGIGLA